MQVSKKEGKVLDSAIEQWRQNDVISEQESQKLKRSYDVIPFDWKRVAKYAFWFALFCIVISISSVLKEDWLTGFTKQLFNTSDLVKCIGFVVFSGALFFWDVRRKAQYPDKVYSNEAIFFLGIATTAAAIAFLGKVVDTGTGHFSLLLLLAAIVYGLLGLWFPSKLVWLFSLLALGCWFGAETGYRSGWGSYYLSMNYPLRFVLFGLVLTLCGSYLFNQWQSRADFLKTTRAVGLLYLLVALWIMSVFGNYEELSFWGKRASRVELFYWSIMFAAASIAAIYHGVKYDDGMTRGFGLTFIFINLYTKFFEYFWDSTHKAIFFAILALSFWYLGSKAEKIWQLNSVKNLASKTSRTG